MTMRRKLQMVMLAGVALLTMGCETLKPNDSALLSRDIYDIKNNLTRHMEEQNSADRQVRYALNSLDENLNARNEVVKSSIEDLEKRIREQKDEIGKLREQLETVSFSLDAINKRLGMSSTGLGSTGQGSTLTTTGTTVLEAPAGVAASTTTGAGSFQQVLTNAQQQFNAGNYPAVRDSLTQALGQNPPDDVKREMQFWLAQSTMKLGDNTAARQNFTAVIQANPNDMRAWESLEMLANVYVADGDKVYAQVMLQQIVDKFPQYPNIERVKATIAQIKAAAPAGATTPPAATPPQQ